MKNLTIAESIKRSSDPHHAAVVAFSRQEYTPNSGSKTYFFEDGSYLVFAITYTAAETGVSA